MQPEREKQKLGREKLQRIIETCRTVEERSLDPFLVDVDEDLNVVRKHFPQWKLPDDLCLDAETIHRLASVVRLQSEWVKHRSTSLYTDPFLLEEKLRRMDPAEIVDTFMQSWHPITALEQITPHSLKEALTYWEGLAPLADRWKEEALPEVGMGSASREELISQRILREKAFSEELEVFWKELISQTAKKGKDGKLRYWDFIGAETYEETVQRAFMTSFLVTYGYATLEVRLLMDEILIVPAAKPTPRLSKKQLVSVPISVSAQEWRRWKRGEQE